jgi:hypothetical protein
LLHYNIANDEHSMDIDPLPVTPSPLKSWGPAARARSAGKTLTLPLAAFDLTHQPMSGRATANEAFASCIDTQHASVVPAPGEPLTVTF